MAYITLQQPYRLQIHAARWFPGAADNAKFVSQKLPDTMVAGQRYDVELVMRNTGLNPWTIGGPNPYRLGSQNPQDNVDWGLRRVDVPSEVPAGSTATFRFSITAPSTRTHQFQWRMLREGVQWFGDFSPAVTVSYLSNAAFVRQLVPATMVAGQSYSVSVTMRNTGTSLWTSGGSNPFRLGSQNPAENMAWGLGRCELPGPVPPGAEVTFAFTVTAPAAGTRHFQWRMLQELVEWFGELSSDVAVNVIPPPALTVSASPSTIRENISTTLTISCKDSNTGAVVAGRVWVAGVDTAATDQAFTRKYNGAEQITVRAAGYPETKVNVQFASSPL